MQSSTWPSQHCQALREFRTLGLSYAEIARALNAKFGTSYTRNAALGRGKRMGLGGPERPGPRTMRQTQVKPSKPLKLRQRQASEPAPVMPAPERPEPIRLRCVGIQPRLLALVDLGVQDCRYPYGGDKEGEAIAFCGHPRLEGSSYCAPHFRLTRGFGTKSERAAAPVMLRLVEAA